MVVKDDLLEQVLLLTRQMREQAQQAAWEEAERTEVQRSRLIAECFDGEEAFGDQMLAGQQGSGDHQARYGDHGDRRPFQG